MRSNKLFPFTIVLSLTLCLLLAVTGLGCSAKKPQKPSPVVKSLSPVPAVQTPQTAPVVASGAAHQKCQPLPPICPGGLLKQTATVEQVNAYWIKYGLSAPLACRYMEPPRCFAGEKNDCTHECTK